MSLMIKLMSLPVIGSFIRKIIIEHSGGFATSKYARSYMSKKFNVDIGMHTYGGCFQNGFNTGGKVTIGRYCSFGPDVRYFGANHPMESISMTPYFYNQEWASLVSDISVNDIQRSELEIGNDCWIGYGVIITSACHKIGNGAVVGAGSVVTHDIEPYSIVAGNPARVLRRRFDNGTIELLEKSKWYELEPNQLLLWHQFKDDPSKFAEMIIKNG